MRSSSTLFLEGVENLLRPMRGHSRRCVMGGTCDDRAESLCRRLGPWFVESMAGVPWRDSCSFSFFSRRIVSKIIGSVMRDCMYNDPIITYKATRLTVSLILYFLSHRFFLLIRTFHTSTYDVENDYEIV